MFWSVRITFARPFLLAVLITGLVLQPFASIPAIQTPFTNTVSAQTVRTPSPPIVATAGQIIRGVKITSTSGPCITIDNAANVWLDNVELGPCAGNGVRVTGAGATGTKVTNSLIHTEHGGADSGVGVYFWGISDLLVQGNQFSYNESSVYGSGSNVRVIGNYSLNPIGPFPRGQHVQFNNVSGGVISDNYGESRTTNVVYQPVQEDAINLYQSSSISVLRNYIVGGWSPSGCGIIVDAGGTADVISDNTVIRTGECGVAIATAVNATVRNNKILDPNVPGGGNIGIYVWNVYAGACSGTSVTNNIVSDFLPSGVYNDYWDAGDCGLVTFTGNTLGSAARALLVPEAVLLPAPPIPPIPYVVSSPPPPPVPAISAVTVSGVTTTSATITWTTDLASTSKTEYGLSSTYGLGALQSPTLVTVHSLVIPALIANTMYHYRVTSVGAAGGSATSADFTFTTAPPAVPVISGVSVSNITSTSATVTWTTDLASSSKIEYGLSSTYGLGTLQSPTLVTAHSLVIPALIANAMYHYRVTSVGTAGGSATSTDFTFTTAPPPVPMISAVAVLNITATSATVTWTTDIASTSKVEYGKSSTYGLGTVQDPTLVTTHSLVIPTLMASTTYHYKVTSVSAAGGSATSTDFTFTTAPRLASSPITATSGQVIRGVKITSATGPCIVINSVANVWVDDVELGPCAGNGVTITGSGATGIRITNSVIHTEQAGGLTDTGIGVSIYLANGALVQGNQFSYNATSVYAVQASNIRVIGNYSLNPLGPSPRGHHVQFNNVIGGEISYNYGESRVTNVTYPSRQESAISLWQSQQISAGQNYLVGGWSPTGCGFIIEGGNNSNNLIADNTVVRTGQCGIAIASGVNNTVRNNKILDTNTPGGPGNIGIYVWNLYPGTCSGIIIDSNIVSNLLPDGTYNDYWNAGNCGSVYFGGNILGSAARPILTPETIQLPPPPVPPRPYIGP